MSRTLALIAVIALGCSTGEGEGEVKSDRLVIPGCWNGPFDLDPSFFAAEPLADSLMIRIQRGDNWEEVSAGLMVLVDDLAELRKNGLGAPLPVGLPPGVSPPGVPITYQENPPKVSLALFLNDTCHAQNATIYSIGGSITFNSLFSGDRNESDAEKRLTDASFEATFADPRKVQSDGSFDSESSSVVTGWFRFYFQRGQPAQPFP
jgi:hypothetical protein